ncbi:MAG: 6-carboxytetrahydropterin synthase QueD [Coriobacteriia bacterium]|nr:6-carboxytetrahydropterin synthase QueD [Coriobacteriia bacterium]
MGEFSLGSARLSTDGGSRGNPGISGIGFVLEVSDGRELKDLCHGSAFIGKATNNVAEYRALIWGLQNACALGVKVLAVQADSELLVKQLKGEYRVKNEGIKPLHREAKQLLEGLESFTVKHVTREENSEADRLANLAMDSQAMTGTYVVAYGAGDLFSLEATAPTTPKTAKKPKETPQKKGSSMATPVSKGSYALTIKEHFDAAHALIGYPGQCKDLHGHTWDIEATVRGTELDEVGIVYDFQDLKRNLRSILDQYDHTYLNEVPPFDAMNATAENLARAIYEQLEALLPVGIELVEVAVWESPVARLGYSR